MFTSPIIDLLRGCGFDANERETGVLFQAAYNASVEQSSSIINFDGANFELLFPYRYPMFAWQGTQTGWTWNPTPEDVQLVYERLAAHVTAAGYAAASTARYLHAYIACPRKDNSDFSQELVYYSDAELLALGQIEHIEVFRLESLIARSVPVDIIRDYDPQRMPMALLNELYPHPDAI